MQRYFPVTRTGHFIKAGPEKVIDALREHARRTVAALEERRGISLEGKNDVRKNVETALQFLDPLVAGGYPTRQLVLESQRKGWVRVLSNNLQFAGSPSRGAYLTNKLQTDSVFFMLQPRTLSPSENEPGAFQFVYFHRGEKRRVVELVYDRSWKFGSFGVPFPFEDTQQYAVRKMTERFTASMLIELLARFGLHPFCDDFYRVDAQHPARGIAITVRNHKLLGGDFKPVSLDKLVRGQAGIEELLDCESKP